MMYHHFVLKPSLLVQEELLQALLSKFYVFSPQQPSNFGPRDEYSQDSKQRTLMTVHALLLLLMFEKFTLDPGEFNKLRVHLKMQTAQLVKLFRCAESRMLSPLLADCWQNASQYVANILASQIGQGLRDRCGGAACFAVSAGMSH